MSTVIYIAIVDVGTALTLLNFTYPSFSSISLSLCLPSLLSRYGEPRRSLPQQFGTPPPGGYRPALALRPGPARISAISPYLSGPDGVELRISALPSGPPKSTETETRGRDMFLNIISSSFGGIMKRAYFCCVRLG